MRAILAGITRIRVLGLRELATHRLRVITSLVVVTVSAALLVAVLSMYGSMTESVRTFNATVSGAATLEVAGITDSGVDGDIGGELRQRLGDTAQVVPLVRGVVVVDDEPTVLLGSDYRASALSPELAAATNATDTGLSIRDLADGIVVGPGTGLSPGQHITIGEENLRVLRVLDGQASALNGGRFVFAYLPLAQRLAGLDDAVDSFLIVPADGSDSGELHDLVAAVVGDRASVLDPSYRVKQAETAGAVVRDSTLLVSMVSLIIAAFLVFNTMNMAVASRRRSLAMIRALGGRRRHLAGDLLGEAVIFGLIGGVLGIPIGMLAGRWALGRAPAGSGAVGVEVTYTLPTYVPFVAVAAAILACLGATAMAAKAVFSVTPVEAMAPGQVADAEPVATRLLWLAAILGVLGVSGAWLIVDLVDGRPAIVAGAVYAVGGLIVCFALTPVLVGAVRSCAARWGGPGQLAAVNAERAPRRVWATVMTVTVAVTVGIGISGALNNMIGSLASSLDGLGEPDLYVSSQNSSSVPLGPQLNPQIRSKIDALPGVERVVGGQWASVNVGDARVLLQGIEPGSTAPFLRKATPEAAADALAGRGLLLSKTLARMLDVQAGDDIRLATPTGAKTVRVLDTVSYVSMDSGVAGASINLLHDWFRRPGDTYLQVAFVPGADVAALRRDITAIADEYPGAGGKDVHVYTGREALAATEQSVKQSGGFTVAIQWIVSGAAAIALVNTLLLSVLERRREIGVLRSMGAARRFIFHMVLAEAGAIALVGAAVGTLMGVGLQLLADAILSKTTSIDIVFAPMWSAGWYVAASGLLCLVGAVLPAWRASRQNITESLVQD